MYVWQQVNKRRLFFVAFSLLNMRPKLMHCYIYTWAKRNIKRETTWKSNEAKNAQTWDEENNSVCVEEREREKKWQSLCDTHRPGELFGFSVIWNFCAVFHSSSLFFPYTRFSSLVCSLLGHAYASTSPHSINLRTAAKAKMLNKNCKRLKRSPLTFYEMKSENFSTPKIDAFLILPTCRIFSDLFPLHIS